MEKEIMGAYDPKQVAGIRESDGSVKCADCMDTKDWDPLEETEVITFEEIERSEELFYCDYCEKTILPL
jgi:hypothetical protein